MNESNPLKIMHVVSGDLWAGAECQVFTLCKYLNRNSDLRVEVIILNKGQLKDRLESEGIKTYLLDESKLSAFQIFYHIRRILQNAAPDVLHTHRQKENILATLAKTFTIKARSVRTQHGAPEFSYSWKQWPKKVIQALDYWCGAHLQQAVIAVSDDLASKLESHYPAGHVHVVENGVDMDALAAVGEPADLKPEGACHIGLVGRLVPVKRVDLFIDMAKVLLKQQETRRKLQFHIFGDGPLRSVLTAQVNRLGLADRITFHGHVHDIASHIKALDVLLMCSDHEGLPMTLLEAMALGVPVVGHNVGALQPYFEQKSGGLMSAEHKANSYANTVSDCLERGCDTVVQRGREAVLANFSAQLNANQIYAFYLRLFS